jgi:formate--tetrahydrofolate ligase
LSDFTVTEAGFAADLGAEKFLNIKCRKAGLVPDAVVLVATVKALKFHGGVKVADLAKPNLPALQCGLANLAKHVENLQLFGLPVIVSINVFGSDTEAELQAIRDLCAAIGVPIATSTHFTEGGKGALELANIVLQATANGKPPFKFLYPDDLSLADKIRTIVQKIYGGDDIVMQDKVVEKLKSFEAAGYRHFPVCMAKTQLSLSADPALQGRPTGFKVHIRDVKLSTGPGFVVALAGDIMTMPGLPKVPSAEAMDVDENGFTVGLF